MADAPARSRGLPRAFDRARDGARTLQIAGLLVAFAGCSASQDALPAPARETARSLAQGEVIGAIGENGAQIWRGLPYAASTAGEQRWRAPRPGPRWQGVRSALASGERCAQLTNAFDADEGLEPGRVVGSEDCLTLDVYAPGDANANGDALPVMVWIHGGGNVWGRASGYDGSRLAQNEAVVVIAVQYRLGPLGWFSHEALRTSASAPEDAAAAFAILDLIAALRWIQENASAFGGDPGNVTILGESAGGHNVVALLASPLAAGLFHRAVVLSGSFDSVSSKEAEGLEGDLANPSKRIAERLGATSAEALRALSTDALYSAYDDDGGLLDVPRMIEDGVVVPVGLRSAFASPDGFHRVPVMLGTTRDEMKLFYFRHERMTKRRWGFLVVARDPVFYDVLTGYISRLWRIRSVDEPAQAMTRAGHDAVYAYRFDWDDGGSFLSMDFGTLLGAAHGFEIPFLFNRFEHLGDADAILFESDSRDARERLSRAMGGYWASFARDGRPWQRDAPAWEPYGAAGRFLRLDVDTDGGIELRGGADDLDALLADLRDDPRLDAEGRCFVVDEMGKWMLSRGIQDRIRAATECP